MVIMPQVPYLLQKRSVNEYVTALEKVRKIPTDATKRSFNEQKENNDKKTAALLSGHKQKNT